MMNSFYFILSSLVPLMVPRECMSVITSSSINSLSSSTSGGITLPTPSSVHESTSATSLPIESNKVAIEHFTGEATSPKFIELHWSVSGPPLLTLSETDIGSFLLTIMESNNGDNSNENHITSPLDMVLPGNLRSFLLGPVQPNSMFHLSLEIYYLQEMYFTFDQIHHITVVTPG